VARGIKGMRSYYLMGVKFLLGKMRNYGDEWWDNGYITL
jgi:hypothetical protein